MDGRLTCTLDEAKARRWPAPTMKMLRTGMSALKGIIGAERLIFTARLDAVMLCGLRQSVKL